MVFPIKSEGYVDEKKFDLEIQIWDKDLLSANDFLASTTVSTWGAIQDCIAKGTKGIIIKDDSDRLEFECQLANRNLSDKKPKVVITIQCLTAAEYSFVLTKSQTAPGRCGQE